VNISSKKMSILEKILEKFWACPSLFYGGIVYTKKELERGQE